MRKRSVFPENDGYLFRVLNLHQKQFEKFTRNDKYWWASLLAQFLVIFSLQLVGMEVTCEAQIVC